MKVVTVVGTRPEIIRLSSVIARLDASVDHVLVHTGQNWDHQLNGVFFEELGIRPPDHVLNVDTSTLGATLGEVISKTEQVLISEEPDAFLVLGDTNSALSLIMAKRLRIPTFHMEAGNRCFDENVPEETNRRIVDHTADFNLVYTEHARRNLLGEGLHPSRIMLTGSPMREVLDQHRAAIHDSTVLEQLGLQCGNYFLVSVHRAETVDNQPRFRLLIEALSMLAERHSIPVLISTHPRTRKNLESLARSQPNPLLWFHEPFGFLDYNKLQLASRCVLSDSGTISEESSILGFPAVTLRDAIERPEAIDTGSIIKVGIRPSDVLQGVGISVRQWQDGLRAPAPEEYAITNTSQRVVNFIISSTPNFKSGTNLANACGGRN